MRLFTPIQLLALTAAALAGCASSVPGAPTLTTASPSPHGAAPAATTSVAPLSVTKVLVVIEENHSLAEARRSMPYLARLATRYGYATHYRAITHPSLPNYLAITGGATFGVSDDASPSSHVIHGSSVFGQAIARGGSARLYGDSQPAACTTVPAGRFATKHAPWAYFVDERAACLKGDLPLAGNLARDTQAGTLPTVSLLIPNLDHDAHDGSLARADTWLQLTLGPVLAGPDFRSGHLAVVVTSDEDDYSQSNTVLTVVMNPALHGKVVSTPLTHYSLTGFIDRVIGAPALRKAAGAPSLALAFGLT